MNARGRAASDVAAGSPLAVAGWTAWWRAQSGARQALVPGAYAWAVTIAPLGWGHRAWYATAATLIGVVSLLAGMIADGRAPDTARAIMGWGVVASGLLTWALVPDSSYEGFDAVRGIAGMLGWGLFAVALGSPARHHETDATSLAPAPETRTSGRSDALVLALGLALTFALQAPGWGAVARERALLVRVVAIAAGLAVLNAAGAIVASRHGETKAPRGSRRRGAFLWVIASALLLGIAVALEAARGAPTLLDGR